MANEEKTAWTSLVSAGVGLLLYVVFVLIALDKSESIADIAYSLPLLGCVLCIVGPSWLTRGALPGTAASQEAERDERDVDIARRSDQVRQQVLLLTCVVVLALALGSAEQFWIASAVFAGVSLSFISGSAVQLHGYRTGIRTW